MYLRGSAGRERAQSDGSAQWTQAIRGATIVLAVLQALLLLRVLLLAFGGDQSNPLVAAAVQLTGPFLEPFRVLLRFPELPASGAAFLDGAAITAFIFWTLVQAIVLVYLAPRIDAKRVDWPAEYDRRYGTIAAPIEGGATGDPAAPADEESEE